MQIYLKYRRLKSISFFFVKKFSPKRRELKARGTQAPLAYYGERLGE